MRIEITESSEEKGRVVETTIKAERVGEEWLLAEFVALIEATKITGMTRKEFRVTVDGAEKTIPRTIGV